MNPSTTDLTVLDLNERLSNVIARATEVRNVWVLGETSDLRSVGGHCYMELVQKDEQGQNISRIRATVWASTWRKISAQFMTATGSRLDSGMKIRALVTAAYHPVYGMSVNISAIDTSYTLGDAVRRRNEIIARLQSEGLLNLNRELRWPFAPQRVAVISASGAAGFGDFANQLLSTSSRLRFSVTLFPALMQGADTVPTVLNALDSIRRQADSFDVVVVIRGGGATSDLASFDDYRLARAVATMPIPVIVGIGHERDTTVLDYVGHRVKTPTAAAELLIDRVTRLLDGLSRFAEQMYRAVNDRMAADREYLAHAESSLHGWTAMNLANQKSRLDQISLILGNLSDSVIAPRLENLRRLTADIENAVSGRIKFCNNNLNYYAEMVRVLSPEAVLSRGFSITTDQSGRTITDGNSVTPGTTITTRLKKGSLTSKTL